ncbi:MAG: hypothetical protein WCS77_03285 [Elusimicrobiaceae bacterium]|jgi:hypothetical protein
MKRTLITVAMILTAGIVFAADAPGAKTRSISCSGATGENNTVQFVATVVSDTELTGVSLATNDGPDSALRLASATADPNYKIAEKAIDNTNRFELGKLGNKTVTAFLPTYLKKLRKFNATFMFDGRNPYYIHAKCVGK